MSYLRAEEILPKEVLELVQQYVSGKAIYVPCREKQPGQSSGLFFVRRDKSYVPAAILVRLTRSNVLTKSDTSI